MTINDQIDVKMENSLLTSVIQSNLHLFLPWLIRSVAEILPAALLYDFSGMGISKRLLYQREGIVCIFVISVHQIVLREEG